jgi:hypothetical protein
MQILFKFLLFGLIFTILHTTNVEAQAPGTPGSAHSDSTLPPTGVATTPAVHDVPGTPGMPPTGVATTPAVHDVPGTPGMPPTGVATTPAAHDVPGTPGMPPTGVAPTGTPESAGISGWIKGGLQALGIGSAPEKGNISHCAEFSGPPKAACEAAAAGN